MSVHWSMHILLSVNREFCLDCNINISALQKKDQIYVRKKTRESHEQAEVSINYCIDHEKFELLWADRRNCSYRKCKSSRMRSNVMLKSCLESNHTAAR